MHRHRTRGFHHTNTQSQQFPLSHAEDNDSVRLIHIDGGNALRKRLAELGLNPGSELRVIQTHFGGPMILAVKGDTRMAIGRGMARKILVEYTAT